MLQKYLHNHTKHNENESYPIFVQSDVTYHHDSGNTDIFPGLIIRTDEHGASGYQVALFDDTAGKENVCDLHDCPAEDIAQFEVARLCTISLKRS